ncbi:menaquinone biosynthesis decarboxylase [Helicobacter sp. MIT 14-3879]|uniref:menaquinone biosynthesis decarboxylase n=1 Tax=Helicobacter sp. MIT 14-3879 TaxID=2040649 RepID=UPI000E1FB07E|nr:menaquinone biosynthesis decarboxylase [Helicobacter sp. MIT 14-3879]RDU65455.1 menaquinone biosynthesis decarboxylase [Helicobacter sp. MIT 14-3879]
MQTIIDILKKHNELKIINESLDIELEIPHIAYIEVKKPDSKALFFTNPICKKTNTKFDIPVLMNIFGSFKRLEILGLDSEFISKEIEAFIKLSAPRNFLDLFLKFKTLSKLIYLFPKKVKYIPHKSFTGKNVDLFSLPITKTWEKDGGRFITMGQVYTQSLNKEIKNLGMYRLQVYDKNHLGMHWQIHKDSNHFFSDYKKAGIKMPVSIAIGGDPIYTWCGQAPLPYGMYELMLYGFIKKKRPKVRKCLSNDLFVPSDSDIVIEGFVDVDRLVDEGPFGDHTGYYTPIEPYPIMEVSVISLKKNPIYLSSVVGKPPLEDKYMGYVTERVFLPLLRMTIPALIDYYMPENGVFHNLILAKIDTLYPSHAEQIMHSFWSAGQMSFVKHAIFVPKDAPNLRDTKNITEYILNNLDINNLFFSSGICDALDHSSPYFAKGGKLGINCTNGIPKYKNLTILDNDVLLEQIKQKYNEIIALRQYFINTKNPITLITIDKNSRVLEHINSFNPNHIRIVFVLDSNNDLDNLYMCLWRIVNNIDANRDILVQNNIVLIDATKKGELESHKREWPDDVDCSIDVLNYLVKLGIIDKKLWRKYHIDKSYSTI